MELSDGIYGLLGKNGAGKTTLINIFMGILKADAGRILVDGKEAGENAGEFLDMLGFLPQYPRFYPEFTVNDFLLYMCALKEIKPRQGKEKIEYLLEELNLAEHRNKKIGALSGGMRQRVGIIQAILNDPKILILDEPTAGLDPQERIRFRNLISQFSENRVTLLATHIVTDVECIASQVIIMDEGKVIAQGHPAQLEKELDNHIWDIKIDKDENLKTLDSYLISNMKREGGSVVYRIIGDKPEGLHACRGNAALEDVFLYYCRGNH